ncbi:MAG: DUF1566 domain-containing protein, partial [Bacteroidota bacterium]
MKKVNVFIQVWALGFLWVLGGCHSAKKTNTIQKMATLPQITGYPIVATGQQKLYDNNGEVLPTLSQSDAFYGQDGNYLEGKGMTYIDHGDKTITDRNTGLMWQKIPARKGMSWEEAVAYCEDLKLAGYGDWRLPNIKELFSISDFSSGWPYLNTEYLALNARNVDKNQQFWSSNKYAGITAQGKDNAAFGVNHATGHIKAYPAHSELPNREGPPPRPDNMGSQRGMPPQGQGGMGPPGGMGRGRGGQGPQGTRQPMGNPLTKFVRAVRGKTYGINSFIDNGDGTVTDTATDLMWSQKDSEKGMNWETALVYAEKSKTAGYTDWRLPNVKELQSIVDYRYAPDAQNPLFNGPAIDPIFICTPILNEAGKKDYG